MYLKIKMPLVHHQANIAQEIFEDQGRISFLCIYYVVSQ